MTKYIGLDIHSSTCSFCVVNNEGEILDQREIVSNGRLLIDYIQSVEGHKKLALEECELSAWAHELFVNRVDELIVCDPVKNSVYKKAKTDKLDAKNLAALLRGGFLKPVYHDGSGRQQFRALMSGYQDIVDTGVRMKNRYASLFRKAGMRQRGSAFYDDESLVNELPRPDQRFVAKSFYGMISSLEAQREGYVDEIKKMSRGFREIKLLKTIPGIGDIQAAKIVSQVVAPERFENKHKFFSYCGLVRQMQRSGGRDYPSARIHGNRILKCVYKMAAHRAITGSSALKEYYESIRLKGASAKAARNAVARKIATISLGVWKNGSKYNDALILESVKS